MMKKEIAIDKDTQYLLRDLANIIKHSQEKIALICQIIINIKANEEDKNKDWILSEDFTKLILKEK